MSYLRVCSGKTRCVVCVMVRVVVCVHVGVCACVCGCGRGTTRIQLQQCKRILTVYQDVVRGDFGRRVHSLQSSSSGFDLGQANGAFCVQHLTGWLFYTWKRAARGPLEPVCEGCLVPRCRNPRDLFHLRRRGRMHHVPRAARGGCTIPIPAAAR